MFLRLLQITATLSLQVASVACASSRAPAADPADANRRVTVSRDGSETNVSITDEAPRPLNADCTTYCERLVECWSDIPGSDPMLGEADVRKSCLSDHEACRTATTETLCCGHVKDCIEFARCQARSHDRVVVCERR